MYAFCDTFVRIYKEVIIQLNFNNLCKIKSADSRGINESKARSVYFAQSKTKFEI
jgi:hypothetical protein